jgi:hypothetical protein
MRLLQLAVVWVQRLQALLEMLEQLVVAEAEVVLVTHLVQVAVRVLLDKETTVALVLIKPLVRTKVVVVVEQVVLE